MIGSVASSAIKQVRFGSTAETKACPLHVDEKTDLAMSRPMVVTACMIGSSKSWEL